MKRLLTVLAGVAIGTIFISCEQDSLIEDHNIGQEQLQNEVIPLDEAMSNLEDFLRSYVVSTKSGRDYQVDISKVVPFGGATIATKTAPTITMPDTLVYLVNFGEDDGFAVVSANRKLNSSVFCLTEKGSINGTEFAEAQSYLSRESVSTKSATDVEEALFTEMGELFVPTMLLRSLLIDYNDGNSMIETKAGTTPAGEPSGPFLATKWHQGSPFNDLLINEDDSSKRYRAGCVAIACAQIMAYNEYPTNAGLNWNSMKTVCPASNRWNSGTTSAQTHVASFVKELGKKEKIHIRYGDNGSWGLADGVVRTLKNYHYHNVDKRLGFAKGDRKKVSESLANNYPVFINGGDASTLEGHAWVIDGEWGNYFHCNWGWHGNWDGFYEKDNCFDLDEEDTVMIIHPSDPGYGVGSNKFNWLFRVVLYTK